MPVANFEDFQNYCESQDVRLAAPLVELTLRRMDSLSFVYNPSPITTAVASAGEILRVGKITPLANEPLKIDHRVLRRGSAALALANIVNGSIEPNYDYGNAAFNCTTDRPIDACKTAEYRFARTVIDIEQENNPNCHIIGNGQPVLLRKAGPKSVPSSLTLTDITIDGVPYPAGSIVRLDLDSDEPYIHSAKDGVESVGLDAVKNVGFIRLSAFALRGNERINFHEAVASSSGDEPIRALHMEEIVQAVQDVYTPSHSI